MVCQMLGGRQTLGVEGEDYEFRADEGQSGDGCSRGGEHGTNKYLLVADAKVTMWDL